MGRRQMRGKMFVFYGKFDAVLINYPSEEKLKAF